MKRSILRAFALCLTTVCAGSIGWAQNDNTAPSGRSSGTATYGTPSSSSATRAGEPVRLSKLMNTSLKSQTGESLGQVQDLVVDPSNGQIQFAVISLNGASAGAPGINSSTTTGIGARPGIATPEPSTSIGTAAGGKLVAVPWRLVNSSGQGQFTASIDRATLQSAPTFDNSSWPTMNSTWMQSVYSHFGVRPNSSTGAPGSSSGTGTGAGTGLGNPSTPGVPSAPGTPDISSPGGIRPPSPTPSSGTGTGTGPGAGGK